MNHLKNYGIKKKKISKMYNSENITYHNFMLILGET